MQLLDQRFDLADELFEAGVLQFAQVAAAAGRIIVRPIEAAASPSMLMFMEYCSVNTS